MQSEKRNVSVFSPFENVGKGRSLPRDRNRPFFIITYDRLLITDYFFIATAFRHFSARTSGVRPKCSSTAAAVPLRPKLSLTP